MVFDYGKYIQQYCILYTVYSITHSLYRIYYAATFTTVSIVSKRLITPFIIIMLPPCSSSLVSSSHSYYETITNRHPRNDALALLSPPSVVLQKGGRGNVVAKARCLYLVHASAENRKHFLHEGGGRLNQGDVFFGLLIFDIAKGVMYSSSSLAAERGASRAQSTAVAIPRSPLFLSRYCLFFFLFYSVFCIWNSVFCIWNSVLLYLERRERRCLSFICCRITLKYFIMFKSKKY